MHWLLRKWWFWLLVVLFLLLFAVPMQFCHLGLAPGSEHCHWSFGLLDGAMPFDHVH